jgi:hypothetical protein
MFGNPEPTREYGEDPEELFGRYQQLRLEAGQVLSVNLG